jgi:dihydrofolate reductase
MKMTNPPQSRKIILYIAMSLDGFIATKNDDLTFLNVVEKEGEDYGYTAFYETVDTVILGRRTYEKVIAMGFKPHEDKETWIITQRPEPDKGRHHFYTGDLKGLVQQLRKQEGKNVFVDGGAFVAQAFLEEHLLDEIIISIIPVLLGDGISLFGNENLGLNLQLLETKTFEKGLVQLHYRVGSKL